MGYACDCGLWVVNMNVIFLDFDGVVNIPMWYKDENGEWDCGYGMPKDGKVNCEQAVQWVSEFCEKFDYSIVVSSTWRIGENFDYAKCLYNSGLRSGIKVIGATPRLYGERGEEISKWLSENPDVENYLIFDDDTDMGEHINRLVKCNSVVGFTADSFNYATQLHRAFAKGE